jgi:hypothetical protein
MPLQRRRADRNAFGGVAQVTDPASGLHLVASASVLGRFGCFVKTSTPFPSGTTVSIRINHDDREFAASARVVHVLTSKGMGIAFGALTPADQAVLEEWLA